MRGLPAQPLGAGYRTRTDTVSLPTDFKSVASTYFANPAYLVLLLGLEPTSCDYKSQALTD